MAGHSLKWGGSFENGVAAVMNLQLTWRNWLPWTMVTHSHLFTWHAALIALIFCHQVICFFFFIGVNLKLNFFDDAN